jgi:hypothetical protein
MFEEHPAVFVETAQESRDLLPPEDHQVCGASTHSDREGTQIVDRR